MNRDRFYILSLEHSQRGVATWWRSNSAGYTADLGQAGVYDRESAKKACSSRSRLPDGSPHEIAVPIDAPMVTMTTILLDGQDLTREDFIGLFEDSLKD